jgi:hypothetical protein
MDQNSDETNRRLQEYLNRETVALKNRLQNAAMDFSHQLALRLSQKAWSRKVTLMSSNYAARLANCYELPLNLKINQGDANELRAVHRICFGGNQDSQVFASYGFKDEKMQVGDLITYYRGGSADIDGLERLKNRRILF